MQEKILEIAIQGSLGAFHEVATHEYFPEREINFHQCTDFPQITNLTKSGGVDYGIIAIENTVAGSIIPNFELIRKSKVKICGEVFLRIEQNLVGNKGTDIKKLQEVHSHPMALLQCSSYFDELPNIKLVKSSDTATSAKEVALSGSTSIAAISSKLAAKRYDLEVLAGSIENNKKNYTRFFILTNSEKSNKNTVNKASLCFQLGHTSGSLAGVLSIVTLYGINLSKIQSHPVVGKPWQYLFYLDLVFENYERYQDLLTAIKPLISDFEILGEYRKGKRPSEKDD